MNVSHLHQQFLSAFSKTWSEVIAANPRQTIVDAYDGTRSWTDFLFAEGSGFFRKLGDNLGELGGVRIEDIRREDDKIDMSYVGGIKCFPKRGWGYASRQLVLIEHENQVERAEEEFYKLLFRIADLKILAFPDWSTSNKNERRDPLQATIKRFSDLARDTADQGRSDNILVLVSGRDVDGEIPRWSYLAPPWHENATPVALTVVA